MATREHGLFRLLDRPAPDAAHGGCYVYGDQDKCVDTGILIFMEGTLTLGVTAIRELAEVAGMSVEAEGLNLEIANAELHRKVEVLEAEKAELVEQLTAVGVAVARAAAMKPA